MATKGSDLVTEIILRDGLSGHQERAGVTGVVGWEVKDNRLRLTFATGEVLVGVSAAAVAMSGSGDRITSIHLRNSGTNRTRHFLWFETELAVRMPG